MKNNLVDLGLVIIFIFPILMGIIRKYDSKSVSYELYDIEKSICLLVALIFSVELLGDKSVLENIFNVIDKIISSFSDIVNEFPQATNVITFLIFLIIIYNILKLIVIIINKIVLEPLLMGLENSLNRQRSSFLSRLVGGVFSFPKAIVYLILVCVFLNIALKIAGVKEEYKNDIKNSKIYTLVDSKVLYKFADKQIVSDLPKILNNSLKIVRQEEKSIQQGTTPKKKDKTVTREVIYYNGVTLDEGIKSNKAIDDYAKSLTRGNGSDREKARSIYSFIGTNINYDDNKATDVLNNNFKVESGAVPTFRTRTGICFDYSCLYVAMARANNLKVRLVTGEGFNGKSWVGHAWNEVYLADEGVWINVDTTFYKAGNYFDSKRFNKDHRGASVAGEW
ncbi:Transglutaminase-like superfamily protein [Clostridium cavendishii DSM 21758]|uniref:Transglutaminase-like superfamily protein n=1 Tax=Clostridium cavendishii DSM 21758 TaxID=1121302 RepID=A0A1M6A897_9CLOT|nr:transglutaminase-like domain-containing protein [Clostridium cavendishii]SHI32671.1 Transglutaminase-like superfamily protein [Clostridium cavendishii DSM 21758]